MKLSIVLPTNRASLSAYARILEALSWAGPDVEVVVRDNSGNPKKREFIESLEARGGKVIFAPPCQFGENFREVIAQATGDFILTFSDDDFLDSEALQTVLEAIDNHQDDLSVVGLIGDYMISGGKFSTFLRFAPLDGPSPAKRFAGFLASGSCSVIQWSIHRREMLQEATQLLRTLPMEFSFYDLILTAIFLMAGRYVNLERYLYHYAGMANWNTPGAVFRNDFKYYAAANLDASVYRLHWLFCAFEGAKLILGNQVAKNVPVQQRLELAELWFAEMRNRLSKSMWDVEVATKTDPVALKIRDKWACQQSPIVLDELLRDLAEVLSMVNPALSERYYSFWSAY